MTNHEWLVWTVTTYIKSMPLEGRVGGLSACLQLTAISEFRTPNRTPKIPAGLGVRTPVYRWKKTIRVSYSHRAPKNAAVILQLGSHSTLAHRRCLCHLLPSTSWGSLLLHIVGGGYHGRGGRLNGGRRVRLLYLSSYWWHGGGGCDCGGSIFLWGGPFQNARLTKHIEPLLG